MKKIAIASASVALAAMPVVGVFAATAGSFTDTVTVTVDGGCTIQENTGTGGSAPGTYNDRTFSANIVAGNTEVLSGVESGSTVTPATPMEVICNTTDASTNWTITGTAANGGALLRAGGSVETATDLIPSGTGTTGGSSFAYSLDGSTWTAVPTTANATIISAPESTTAYAFNPTYRVYVAPTQQSGTYSGSITYTVALP